MIRSEGIGALTFSNFISVLFLISVYCLILLIIRKKEPLTINYNGYFYSNTTFNEEESIPELCLGLKK